MALVFEWNPVKARINEAKHGISFEEAASVFGDPLSLMIMDPLHSVREERFVTVGTSHRGRLLVVVYADRGDRIRIISGRRATPQERRAYEEKE